MTIETIKNHEPGILARDAMQEELNANPGSEIMKGVEIISENTIKLTFVFGEKKAEYTITRDTGKDGISIKINGYATESELPNNFVDRAFTYKNETIFKQKVAPNLKDTIWESIWGDEGIVDTLSQTVEDAVNKKIKAATDRIINKATPKK